MHAGQVVSGVAVADVPADRPEVPNEGVGDLLRRVGEDRVARPQ